MTDSGIELELTARQVGLLMLLVGLAVGGFGGFSVASMTTETGATQPAAEKEQPDAGMEGQDTETGEPETDSSSGDATEFTSLDGIDFDGEPTKGDPDAPIKIVEYNEFGCPFCAEFQGIDASARIPIDQLDVAGKIESQYVEEGKVQVISKDYPVPNLHPNGPEAHKAANCVFEHEQDRYWDYHDRLFERRDDWMQSGDGETRQTFREIAQTLDLETETVMQCYNQSENEEANEDKTNAVQNLGRFGTPTYFVGNRETGFIQITGAQPLQRFEQAFATIEAR